MPTTRHKRTKAREARGKKDFFGRIYGNRTEVLAVAIAVVIVAVLLSLSGPQSAVGKPARAGEMPQKVADCIAGNPDLAEDVCWDTYYHEMAVTERDASFCDMIQSQDTKTHCERYF